MSDDMSDMVVRDRNRFMLKISGVLEVEVEHEQYRHDSTYEVVSRCPWIGWFDGSTHSLLKRIQDDISHARSVVKYLDRK